MGRALNSASATYWTLAKLTSLESNADAPILQGKTTR
jgi:hypothetical protein